MKRETLVFSTGVSTDKNRVIQILLPIQCICGVFRQVPIPPIEFRVYFEIRNSVVGFEIRPRLAVEAGPEFSDDFGVPKRADVP
jgi:hypothetical protein